MDNPFADTIAYFSPGQPTNGPPLGPIQPQSGFFDNLLSGAFRGAQQSATTSDFGTKLQGWLTQGQSQVAAQKLFGNPVILMAALGAIVLGIIFITKR